MARYLLTCSCGRLIDVEAGQAGGQVVCDCGKKVDVPTLRNLRHLPVAAAQQAAPTVRWSPRKGITAFFLIAAAILAAVALWNRLNEPSLPEFQPEAMTQVLNREIDSWTPVEAWKRWIAVYRPLAERGFTPLEAVDAERIQNLITNMRFLQSTLLIAAGVSVAIAGLTALWPKGTAQR